MARYVSVAAFVRAGAVAAAMLAGAALVSCGKTEEELRDNAPSATATESVSSQPTPTVSPDAAMPSDWKLYADSKIPFAIHTPPGLSLAAQDSAILTGGGKLPESEMNILTFRSEAGSRALDIGAVKNSGKMTLSAWIDGYDPCPSDFDSTLPPRSQTVVAGYPAIVCPIDQVNQANPRVYWLSGDFVFVFVGNVNGLPDDDYQPGVSQADFDLILKSFRLTG